MMSILLSLILNTQPAVAADTCPYPAEWWQTYSDPASWEVLPDAAKFCVEVILSKRNELGNTFSNFAATPFEYHGKKYASLEGFWQMMKFPENADDPRAKAKGVTWTHTRDEVAAMVGFDAKHAGDEGSANMQKMGIDWVSFEGKQFPYKAKKPGDHYKLIWDATRAKLAQNAEIAPLLLKTGNLILKPDHSPEVGAPPEWAYYDIWTTLRTELQNSH